MAKYLLVILFCSFSLFAFGQQNEKKITATYTELSLPLVINDFGKQTAYKFYYNPLVLTGKISASFKDTPLTKALEEVLKNANLNFTLDHEGNVFIYQGELIKIASINQKVSNTDASTAKISFDDLKIDTGVFANKKYHTIGKATDNVKKEVVLSGYLFRVSTKNPVKNAVISIDQSSLKYTTDSAGYFKFKIMTGKHELYINTPNLQEEVINLEVNAAGTLNVGLREKMLSLKEIVVSTTAAKRNVEQTVMGVERLDIKRIRKIPTVFGEPDILKVILTLPGVKTTGEASAGFNVRGGATDQNLIVFNNMTIYNPTHFLGFFSAFNSEIVKDIELYKSSIPAKYGGRLSSVLEINGITGDSSKIKGSAGIGLITSRINLEGPIANSKTTFVFGARTTYSDWLLKALPSKANFKKSSVSFYDVNLGLNHKIDEKNSLNMAGYLSHDDFKLDSDTTNKYNNKNITLDWKHRFNATFQGDLVLGYDGYNYSVESNKKPTEAFLLAYGVEQFNGKLLFSKSMGSKNKLDFGLDTKLYKVKPGNLSTASAESLFIPVDIEPEKALETGLFLSDKIEVSKKLSFDLGLRFSLYNYLGPKNVNFYQSGLPIDEFSYLKSTNFASGKNIQSYHKPEIRLSARYSILDNLSIKASYNTLAQYMHLLSNTTTITPTDVWKLSDNNIKPQDGSQVSFGIYNNSAKNTIEVSLEGYYKKIKNYLDYKSGAKIILNEYIEREVVNTEGKAYGVEFMLKKNTGTFNGWISYTYSRTFLRTNDLAGEQINNGAFYPSNYDKPHDVTLVGNYRFAERFSLSINTTYSTGRPITLPIGKYYYLGSERLLYSNRNEYRVPDYFRMDLSFNLDGNHKLKQKTHNSWSFGLYNLTGRDNAYSVFYNQENGRIKGYKLTIFSDPMPFVNYNIRF